MKKSNLILHEGTVKHRKACESVLKSNSNLMKEFCKKSTTQRDQVKVFEVKYAVGIACHGSISSVDHYTEIVSEFSKGQPLENVKLHRTKCSAILKKCCEFFSILEDLISELKKYLAQSTFAFVFVFSVNKILVLDCISCIDSSNFNYWSCFVWCHRNFLKKHRVDIRNCIGFSIDGANNVCGAHNSVLSRLRKVNPKIIFVKCRYIQA